MKLLCKGYNQGYTESVKTAISIPDDLFQSAEDLAKQLGIPRSQLYAIALKEYVKHCRTEEVTRRLDELYAKESARVDSLLERLQTMTIRDQNSQDGGCQDGKGQDEECQDERW